ncbi:MAG: bifunctional 5,10-methylenetetrahydrofolate dehydrogenase/5,10-methenyltetrahydrofolate cyclohydrolase [archaeon]
MTIVMSGVAPFEATKEKVREEVERFRALGITPGLAAILVSDEPMSQIYVSMKQEDCKDVGIYSEICRLTEIVPQQREKELIKIIQELNVRDDITGMLVQMPLPDFVDKDRPFQYLSPEKDVDGLTPKNKGVLMSKYELERDIIPCTAAGIVELLDYYGVELQGKDAVIMGRSDLVGRPLRKLLEDRDATPLCCHRNTKATLNKIASADIVISAAGRPPEIYENDSFKLTGDMVKDGVVVVGVGGKRHPETGKVHFDVDFKSVKEKASFVTPNTNGVGLMTRGRLLWNTILTTSKLEKILLNPY